MTDTGQTPGAAMPLQDLAFNVRRCPPMPTLIALYVFLFCWHLPVRAFELSYYDDFNEVSQAFMFIQFALLLIGCCSMMGHGVRRYEKHIFNLDPVFNSFDYSHCMQLSFCSFFTLASIVCLLNQALHKSVYLEEPHFVGVQSDADYNAPLNPHILFSSFSVAACPLLLGSVYYDALRDIYWLWWVVCFATLLAAALIMKDIVYAAVMFYLYAQFAVVFFAIRQNVWVAYLKDQLRQHEQALAMSAQDSNMKHILANVAHDLKTVSQTRPPIPLSYSNHCLYQPHFHLMHI